MSPRERFLAALRGDPVDRVPLELPGLECPSREALAKIEDPRRRILAERAFPHLVVRKVHPSHTNRYLMTPSHRIRRERRALPDGETEITEHLDTPKGPLTAVRRSHRRASTWWQIKYPVETRADIEKMAAVPWERPAELVPPSRADLPEDAEGRFVFATHISSPFVCVAGMMDYGWFLELCATDLPLIQDLTELCLQRTLDCLRVLLAGPGIEYVWIGGSEWVTPPMGSPRLYDALVQEPERVLIEYIHQHSNAFVHVHCHGRVRHALPRVIERGGDYLEPMEPPPDGDITLAEAKEVAAGRLTLGGNIECRILCNGTPDEVERAARAAFEGGKERFVLRPTEGPSPRPAEREYANYVRLMDVWDELSPC